MSKAYRDPNLPIDERVEDLLQGLSREEKIGQCQQVCYRVSYKNDPTSFDAAVAAGRYGSRILSDGGFAGNDGAGLNIDDLNRCQRAAVEQSAHGIPLLFGRDVIYGQATIFPIPLAQAASFDPELVEQAYTCIAREAAAVGVHWSFAPMMDIARDPRWGRVIEGSGEDPYLASRMAVAAVRGFQGDDPAKPERILACAKHFVAYGAAEGGRDYDTAEVSDNTLHNIYLVPFQAAVCEAGVASIMSGFQDMGGVPASGNPYTLTTVLKDEWGFEGFVVSDWGSVEQLRGHGVAADTREAAAMAFSAGVDMEMTAFTYEHLGELIDQGLVSEARLDDAVRRILRAKFTAGLFERPYIDPATWQQVHRRADHIDCAVRLGCASTVLLRNDGILPLPIGHRAHIVVGGPYATEKRGHCGSWCLDWSLDEITSIAEGLEAEKGDGDAWIEVDEGGPVDQLVRKAMRGWGGKMPNIHAVVLCVGESEASNGEASNIAELRLPAGQEELIEALGKRGMPLVVVNCSGRPLPSPAAERYAKAILYTWNLGSEAGTTIARVLYGQAEPGGRLPVSIPRHGGQIPLYYNHKQPGKTHDWPSYQPYCDQDFSPLYPFGYGLGYTSWHYSNISCSAAEITTDASVTVSVNVHNSGTRAGSTVVQCYIRDPVASTCRPVRELKGFRRINLEAGASQVVEFELGAKQLAHYGAKRCWQVEPGEFQVFIGSDSQAELQTGFRVR